MQTVISLTPNILLVAILKVGCGSEGIELKRKGIKMVVRLGSQASSKMKAEIVNAKDSDFSLYKDLSRYTPLGSILFHLKIL